MKMIETVVKTIRIEAVFSDGFLRAGMAVHSWKLDDPLTVQIKFVVVINSIPITKDEFGAQPLCPGCQGKMRFGTFGVLCKDGDLRCLNCSTFGQMNVVQEESWTVGLQLYIDALLDRADREIQALSDVIITRPSKNDLLMTLRGTEPGEWMKVVVPIGPLKSFLHSVNNARQVIGPTLDKTYTETGIAALEKMANGVD